MKRVAGFTLIEVMVATGLMVTVFGLCWSGYSEMRKLAYRADVRVTLHQQAGMLHRVMSRELSAVHPAAMMRVEGSNDGNFASLSLTFLTSRTDAAAYDHAFGRPPTLAGVYRQSVSRFSCLAWSRWTYRVPVDSSGAVQGYGSILHASNQTFRRQGYRAASIPGSSSAWWLFGVSSSPRRNYLRDMDDNGSAWWFYDGQGLNAGKWTGSAGPGDSTQAATSSTLPSGMTMAKQPEAGSALMGDGSELEANMAVVCPLVRDFRLQWVWDDPSSATPATSSIFPPPGKRIDEISGLSGTPFASATDPVMIDDAFAGTDKGMCAHGYWLDGEHSVRGPAGTITVKRPVILRVAFTLIDPAVKPKVNPLFNPDGTPDTTFVSQSFSFSFPISPIQR